VKWPAVLDGAHHLGQTFKLVGSQECCTRLCRQGMSEQDFWHLLLIVVSNYVSYALVAKKHQARVTMMGKSILPFYERILGSSPGEDFVGSFDSNPYFHEVGGTVPIDLLNRPLRC